MFRLAVTARAHATRTLSTSLPRFNAAAAAQPEIRARLKDALKTAMKSKDKEATGCIRSLMSDITYFEKSQSDPNAAASNDSVVNVLRKAASNRRQASESYPSDHPNHTSLLSEIELIESFLPRSIPQDKLREIIGGIVGNMSEEERTDKSATGKVLVALWEKVNKNEVEDKKALGKMVGEMLRK